MKRGTRLYCIALPATIYAEKQLLKVGETYFFMKGHWNDTMYELFEHPKVAFAPWLFLELPELSVEEIEQMDREIEMI